MVEVLPRVGLHGHVSYARAVPLRYSKPPFLLAATCSCTRRSTSASSRPTWRSPTSSTSATLFVLSAGLFLLCGSVGFAASFWFVRQIYSAIKVD